MGLATAYYTKGDLATGAEVGEEALAAAERTGDPLDLLLAHVVVGFPFFDRGNFSQALNEYEQAIGLYDPSQHASFAPTLGWDRGVHAHAYAAWCHLCLGHHNRALALSEEAVALARRASPAISPVGLVAAVLLLVALAFYRMRRWREERD